MERITTWCVNGNAEDVRVPRVGNTVNQRVYVHSDAFQESDPTRLTRKQSFESNDFRQTLVSALADDGFAFAEGSVVRSILGKNGGLSDWREFAESWFGMPVDKYMADGGAYRRRRYCVFSTCSASDEFQLEPPSPHFQSLVCNTSNGGIERWYEPFSMEIANATSLRTILKQARAVFEELSSNRTWHIEVHQFRIEVFANEVGKPTPEGIHRDGVAFGMVMMIDRTNVLNGETTIYRNGHGDPIGRFTLVQPLASLLFDDTKVFHAVSSIVTETLDRRGFRDVLVITFNTTRR